MGIDVEALRQDVATLALARRFFSPAEAAALERLPEEDRTEAFFNCWTRKEAYVKARGLGLSLPLNSFAVSVQLGEAQLLLADRVATAEREGWILLDVAMVKGFGATVVVQHPTRVPRRSGSNSSSPRRRRWRNECLNPRQAATGKSVLTITTSTGAKAINIIGDLVYIPILADKLAGKDIWIDDNC